MAGIKSTQVYTPVPDQSSTTGAVAVAPTSTTAPTDATTALPQAWDTGGYVSEDGITLSVSKSFNQIRDWSHATVKSVLSEYDGAITVNFLQVDEFAAKRVFGTSNVTKTAATTTKGELIKVSIGTDLPPVESWCFNMKDGDARVRVYVPKGQITEVNEMAFTTDGVIVGGTLTTDDDGTGHSIYVFFDDGQKASA